MNKLIKIFCLLLLASCVLPCNADSFNVDSCFEVHSENPNLRKEVEKELDFSYRKLRDFLGYSLTCPVNVFMTKKDTEFDSLVGGNFPDWGIAAAIPQRDLIVLKSPTEHGYLKSMSTVLAHELAHLFLAQRTNRQNLPRWLDEGFAMYIAEEWRWSLDLSITKAVFTGSILDLTEIDSLNSFITPKAHLAYVESFLAINYFIQEYGEDGFTKLLGLLAGGADTDLALIKTIGSNHQQFSDEFAGYLKRKYGWTGLLDETLFLWLLLAFLVVVFYFVKKLRAKRMMRSWEEEEQDWQKEK